MDLCIFFEAAVEAVEAVRPPSLSFDDVASEADTRFTLTADFPSEFDTKFNFLSLVLSF